MPDQNVQFTFKEVAEALVRQAGLTDGHWGILLRFGIQGMNITNQDNKEEMIPAALVPVMEIGLQRFSKPSPLSVDAAKVTPGPAPMKRRVSRPKV
jgi:hypothetical protein